jgi:putative ABC transport system permease protein
MISADYFPTMGIPLIAGRNFTDRETENSSGVILINEALAKRDFPGEDPLGKQLIIDEDDPHPREIIGVVGNVRYVAMNQEPVPELYLSYLESPWKHMSLVVKKNNGIGDPSQLIPAIRREVSAVSTAIPVSDVKLMSEYISTSIATNRLYFLLLGSFACTALVLAALGIYGVMSQTVAQRTREIGIRLALGAQRLNVFKLIIGQGMALTIVGLAAGWLIASALTRVLQSVLYDVSPLDPIIFASVGFMLMTVSALTCYLPARRATKIDPINALREE